MEKRILHILADDKFSDYAIEQFESLSIPSDYALVSTEGDEALVHLRNKTTIMRRGDASYMKMLASLSEYKAIILHGMFWRYDYDILTRMPTNTKVAWVNWGGEIYGRKDVYYDFLSPRSRVMEFLHSWKSRLRKNSYDSHYELPLDVFCRVNYCMTDEQEEYEYAKRYLQSSKLEHLFYNYYTLEDMVGPLIDKRSSGNNIFMGNCGANECNYWDAMPKISKLKVKDQKIIIPLGYGAPWVKNMVLRFGKWLYGEDFMPLTDFLPREQYNDLICNCSTMIMPHYAPRAQGNIITALWLGMRVYLSEHNMTYHYFKRLGCTVYSIEKDLKQSNKERFMPMTDEELAHNRKILYATYSRESTMKAVQHIAETLTKEE